MRHAPCWLTFLHCTPSLPSLLCVITFILSKLYVTLFGFDALPICSISLSIYSTFLDGSCTLSILLFCQSIGWQQGCWVRVLWGRKTPLPFFYHPPKSRNLLDRITVSQPIHTRPAFYTYFVKTSQLWLINYILSPSKFSFSTMLFVPRSFSTLILRTFLTHTHFTWLRWRILVTYIALALDVSAEIR